MTFLDLHPSSNFGFDHIVHRLEHLYEGLDRCFGLSDGDDIIDLKKECGDPNIFEGLGDVVIIEAVGITEFLYESDDPLHFMIDGQLQCVSEPTNPFGSGKGN